MTGAGARRFPARNAWRARSRHDRVLAGVMGGIAQRFGWNSTALRIIYVLVSILSAAFPGILVYLILWLLMPEEGV